MPILDDYHRDREHYQACADKIERLIAELLDAQRIRVHSVTTRIKSAQSLEDKISREAGKYGDLTQITDLCGARIITYFEDEVDKIASLIEQEFLVDPDNSIDKRTALDVDRFGYASVHYVVQIDPRRAALSEYKRFAGIRFEVQVRSILQHAWAEIEHDLQYKSKDSIPRELRRRFARLAGLLEIADVEFRGIRDALSEYRNRISEEIKSQPETVLIDRESVTLFIQQNETVQGADKDVASAMHLPIVEGVTSPDLLASMLSAIGLNTVIDVENELRGARQNIAAFVAELRSRNTFGSQPTNVKPGISLLYLAYVIIVRADSVDSIRLLLDKTKFNVGEGTEALAKELLAIKQSLEGKAAN